MKIKDIYSKIIFVDNDHVKFLPLLVFYIIFILLMSTNEFYGDEGRYIYFAENLLQGFYSPPAPNVNLTNGPGYPLLIALFINFGSGLLILKMINAFLMYYAVFFLFKSQILLHVSEKRALLFSYFLGLGFPHILLYVQRILTEIFSIFLVTIFIYLCLKNINNERIRIKKLILPAFILGYLVLTKLIFAYIVPIYFVLILIIRFLTTKARAEINKNLLVILISFLFVLPYPIYTYSLTGKIYYWGTGGGAQLYWMTSPYQHEYGDWYSSNLILSNHEDYYLMLDDDDSYSYDMLKAKDSALSRNHASLMNEIRSLTKFERDDIFKRRAFENLKNYPIKFFKNWLSNIGRILFHYPLSYKNQNIDTFIIMIPAGFILFLFLLITYPVLLNFRRIPYVLKFLMLFISIYFFLSSGVGAVGRMFFLIIPFLIIWISYSLEKFLDIKILKDKR